MLALDVQPAGFAQSANINLEIILRGLLSERLILEALPDLLLPTIADKQGIQTGA